MGHALVGHFLEFTDPVHKISVVSRGQALGFTISLPTEDKFLTTKQELMDTLSMTLGGRAAEEVVFGEITTGAANDLEKATATAKQMIMRYGMSEELGPRTLGHDQSMPFLGREMQHQADYSEEIARQIDDEIRRIIEEAHQRAKDLLGERRDLLDRISRILITRETIEAHEFQGLVDGLPEEEVFRERDERERRRHAELPEPEKRQRAKQPPVPKPAHVNPVNPEAT
jgi:cell division protease FtsH